MLAIVAVVLITFTALTAIGARKAQAQADDVAASMTSELSQISDAEIDGVQVRMAMGQVPDLDDMFANERGRVTGTFGQHQLQAFVEIHALLSTRCVRATIDGSQRAVTVFEPSDEQPCSVRTF